MRTAALIALFSAMITIPAIVSAGQITRNSIPSPSLGRAMAYQIYVPDDYVKGRDRLPVLYLLHGAGGNELTWTKLGKIKATVDRLITTKAVPPVIIVMPRGENFWWVDGPHVKAESAIWKDFIPAIEERYGTRRDREGRFFAGLSAGGYGVVRYALKYPDKIAAAAALSPAIYLKAPPMFSAARCNRPFLNHKGHFSLAAWHQRNYPRYMAKYLSQPARVSLYLMSGRQDRYGIANEVSQLYEQLHRHQPGDVVARYVDGGHKWRVWAHAIGDAMIYILNRRNRALDFP